MTTLLNTLNSQFALVNTLRFVEVEAGLPVVEISSPLGSARIALQGAHVLTWQPAGHQPVLWVSKAAQFAPGKPVRGGVPVCWPWFGPRDGLPAHGFVRTRPWQVRQTSIEANGEVLLRLGISDDDSTRALWDFAFDLELVVRVGTTLTMALITRNTGTAQFTITEALHTYFCVGDITQTRVQGLEDCNYLDKVQGMAQARQTGEVSITHETDRIYIDTRAECLIDDRATARVIRIAKTGSTTTVVWNPWSEREKTFADMAAGEYRHMLCVETCNAGPDQISVLPGGIHTLWAMISIA
jgi:D-hexose-6-phosphate mutarotase